MRNLIRLFGLLFVASIAFSCIEEDTGLAEMQTIQELNLYEQLANGTGLPRGVEMKSVTFTNKEGETTTEELPHVRIFFRTCDAEWCKAQTDDCGASQDVSYSFDDTEANAKLRFDGYQNVPALGLWAGTETFDFDRDGVHIKLSCEECPGTSNRGFRYDHREVALRVVY